MNLRTVEVTTVYSHKQFLKESVKHTQELRGRRYRTCIGKNNHKTSKSLEREMQGEKGAC